MRSGVYPRQSILPPEEFPAEDARSGKREVASFLPAAPYGGAVVFQSHHETCRACYGTIARVEASGRFLLPNLLNATSI